MLCGGYPERGEMAEVQRQELASGDAGQELKDMIEHWVNVIDRWVQSIDSGLGSGTDDGAAALRPGISSDPGLDAAPAPAGTG